MVVRWQWRWRPIHLSSSSLRLSHSSSCTSKMRDESDAIASGSSADTSTSRCGSRIGRSSEASKASGSSWGRGGAGVRRRCRESRRAGVAVVEAHLRSVGGTQSHRSAPRRRRAAACAVERNGARLVQRPSHHLRRRAGGGEPSKWQSGGDAAAALAPAALASSVARTGARPEGRPSGRIGCSLAPPEKMRRSSILKKKIFDIGGTLSAARAGVNDCQNIGSGPSKALSRSGLRVYGAQRVNKTNGLKCLNIR